MGGKHPKPHPSASAPSPELSTPWRPVNWREKEEILKELRDLKPCVEPLRILLHGPVGAGKSCFVNSVQRALLGRNIISALENSAAVGISFTSSITTHKMKKGGGGHYPFVFSDIMGLEAESGGIQKDDIFKVLSGHILDGYQFNPRGSITDTDSKYNKCPKLCDKVYCLVSIVPADAITRMQDSVITKMKEIRLYAAQMKIPHVIVLTKVDKACEIVNGDLKKLYYSRKIKEKFHPLCAITENDAKYNKNVSLCDKIHCLVSILPGDALSIIDPRVIAKMKTVREKATKLKIPHVIVLTKVDQTCEMVNQDLTKVYDSRKIKDKVQTCSNILGISLNSIYPVKNYYEEITQDDDTDTLILMALRDIVNFANDYMEDQLEEHDK
ncbi:hypothetical protein MHYP_G00093190 [Metynnis hypsauchen]